MAEEGSLPIDYKNLHDLRVVDLKKELEKRCLSKSGSKKDLVDRLKTQLKIEELREKSKSTSEGAQAPSIQLSEGGHNEIVKNYLQQREKLYEQQMEQKKKYQEEASRSQESESQSETDDGISSQMKSGKQELVGANKLSDVEEDEADNKNEDSAAEEHGTEADQGKGNDDKTKDKEEPMDDIPAGSLDKGAERRSRSRSGSLRSRSSSAASSRSADRSRSGSRSESEKKKASEVTAGPAKPSPKRVTRSRSPSVEEVRSRSSSPEGRSPRAKQPLRSAQPVSGQPLSPPAKKIRRSRSASSSGSESPAEDQKQQGNAQKRRSSKDSASQQSGSESSKRSSPRSGKGSRSRSSSSGRSSASRSRERLPLDESSELQQQRKKLESSSSSQSEDESRGKLQRKSRSHSRSSVEADEDAAAAADKPSPQSKHLPEDKKALPLKSVECEIVGDDSGKDRTFAELKQVPAELKAAGDGLELTYDKTEPKVENFTSVDQVTLSRSLQDNDERKAEEIDVKPTRKRRWGSTTLKTITCQPSINISTESLKAMIPEMKGSVLLPELMPELDSPSPEPQNHQDTSQTKTAEAEEVQEEAETAEAVASGPVPEESAVKRQVSHKSQESTKQKGQESVKLSRTIFQVVKADDDYEEDQELNKSSENMETEEAVPESEAVVEPNGRKVVEVTKGVTEEDKKDVTKEVRRVSRLQVPVIPVDDPQPVGRRSPSPAKNSATNIVHIHRLVRPYTLGQLKELLSQTGSISEDGFWIDKIKSHCLVVYSSVDEAVATRRALHGKRWPLSNPNVLRVEYSTQEEFDMFKNAKDGVIPKPVVKPEEVQEKKKEERVRPLIDPPKDAREPEKKEPAKPAARDVRTRAKERSPPVREWDRDKIRQSRSRSRDRNRKEEKMANRGAVGPREKERESRDQSREERRKRRAASQERKEKKAEKVEAEPPAKLLDDLFRKTKAMPCIYWLPLTEEQIAQKMAARQQMEAERECRRQEREQQQVEEEREQKAAAARARDDRIAKENKRDDRRPDRRDRSLDTKQKEPEDGVKKSGASGVSGGRNDRSAPRR